MSEALRLIPRSAKRKKEIEKIRLRDSRLRTVAATVSSFAFAEADVTTLLSLRLTSLLHSINSRTEKNNKTEH